MPPGDQASTTDGRTTTGRPRLHGLWAMLLAPLGIAVAVLTWWLLALWLTKVISYPTHVLVLMVLRTLFILGAIPMVVIFVAGAIQLVTGKRLGLVESLYERKSKE